MGFFWLTLTLISEILGYVLRYFFGVWAAHYLLLVYGWLPVSRLHPVTPAQIGWSFGVIGLLMHLYILARQLPKPQQQRCARPSPPGAVSPGVRYRSGLYWPRSHLDRLANLQTFPGLSR